MMIFRELLATAALIAFASPTFAQSDWPNRTITLIVPFAAANTGVPTVAE